MLGLVCGAREGQDAHDLVGFVGAILEHVFALCFPGREAKISPAVAVDCFALAGLFCSAQPPIGGASFERGREVSLDGNGVDGVYDSEGEGEGFGMGYTEELFLPPPNPGASPLSVSLFGRGLRFHETSLVGSVWGWL